MYQIRGKRPFDTHIMTIKYECLHDNFIFGIY